MTVLTLTTLLLSAPCVEANNVEAGTQITCDGVLWPVAWSRQALQCKKVDLPLCEKLRKLDKDRYVIDTTAQARRLEICDAEVGRLSDLVVLGHRRDRKWYENPRNAATLGVVGGIVVGVALAKWALP